MLSHHALGARRDEIVGRQGKAYPGRGPGAACLGTLADDRALELGERPDVEEDKLSAQSHGIDGFRQRSEPDPAFLDPFDRLDRLSDRTR